MVPLLILKFGVCGLTAYMWLHRYAKTKSWAVIAACLYAFSGFTVYNTFFNHFVDCIALFPLLLWALDKYMYEDVHALFPVTVALNLVNNYFFFAGQIVFLFIYFLQNSPAGTTASGGRKSFSCWPLNPCWAWPWAACCCGPRP